MSTGAVMEFLANYDYQFWGNIAAWVGSIGSILAFFTAAIVFLFDRRSIRRNFSQVEAQLSMALEQLEIQKFQIESEQASKIGVWFELQKVDEQSDFYGPHERELVSRWQSVSARMRSDMTQGTETAVADYKALRATYGEAGPSKAYWVVAMIQNNSDFPVYELKVRLTGKVLDQSMNEEALSLLIFAPTASKIPIKVSLNGEPLILSQADEQAFLAQIQTIVTFRDNSGIAWKREGGGKLTRSSS